MEENDHRTNDADGANDDGATGDQTRVGQVVQSLTRVTRQLPAVERRARPQIGGAALRERVTTLTVALGDPVHPLHQHAVDDLVSIGPPAVPALAEALDPQRPWLTAYRAAEALGQIGDGRAAGPLLEALRHPNSNVRWSAVRALATVGDARALIELRRVARDDRGKTSWGESVAGAAQSVLDDMQSRNLLFRGADLMKTAVACVFMLVSLILAWSIVSALREELSQIGLVSEEEASLAPLVRTAAPTPLPDRPTPEPTVIVQQPEAPAVGAEATPPPDAAAETPDVTAVVLASGNVRAQPARANNVIGSVTEGDEVVIVATTPDRAWYRITLSERVASASRIQTPDGSGWVARSLLNEPPDDVPVEEVALPTQEPAPPEATPLPAP